VLERLRTPWIWLVTIAVGAMATIFSSWITQIPAQLANPQEAKDSIRSGPDFSVSVDTVRLDDEGRSAVFQGEFRPSAAQQRILSRPGAAAAPWFDRFVHAAGGVNLDDLTVRLTLTGHRNQQIDILDIRPDIVRRTVPLSGTYVCVPSQGGPSTMNMVFDMDRPSPIARDIGSGGSDAGIPGRPFFGQRTITLRDTEQQVVLARAFTARHYAAFRLDVTYMLGDKEKHAVIDDHRHPFQVTAISPGAGRKGSSYRRVFSLQNDYSVCQSAGSGASAAAEMACTPC
jgi:hypothetical protein